MIFALDILIKFFRWIYLDSLFINIWIVVRQGGDREDIHIFKCDVCLLIHHCHLRGGLASVAMTTNLPTGLWNPTRPSNLSLVPLTIIYSATDSGSRLYMCIFVWWTWHSCSQDFFKWVGPNMACTSKDNHLSYLSQYQRHQRGISCLSHTSLQFELMGDCGWGSESYFTSVAFYVFPSSLILTYGLRQILRDNH